MNPLSRARGLVVCAAASALWFCGGGREAPSAQATPSPVSFAAQIAALSEPPGYFDTDNLISNETAYLEVLPDIERAGLRGGAYIGVGPDQNFSYIAAARPDVAFIVDVRRDNLLLHLLFKAIFALARTRVDYLALLCGRSAPADLQPWTARKVEAIVGYVDKTAASAAPDAVALHSRVMAKVQSFGVTLTAEDLATVDRFHRRFIEAGLDLRFESLGRSPQAYYPTFRQLLLGADAAGRRGNYLASEEGFQFLKSLQARDMVIPVVGDLSGATSMPALARWLRAHDERVSLFYASNVEFYLFREGRHARFVNSLSNMPRADHALIIRSVFGGGGGSVSLTQSLPELVEGFARGRFRSYYELTR